MMFVMKGGRRRVWLHAMVRSSGYGLRRKEGVLVMSSHYKRLHLRGSDCAGRFAFAEAVPLDRPCYYDYYCCHRDLERRGWRDGRRHGRTLLLLARSHHDGCPGRPSSRDKQRKSTSRLT